MKIFKSFPFLTQHQRGDRVKLLHELGRCAVARVWPAGGQPPYYLVRYKQHYASAEHLSDLHLAFAELRAALVADEQHESELLTPAELADALSLTPAQWDELCWEYQLEPCRSHTRPQVRRALTAKRGKRTGHYLSLLNK